MKTTLILYLVGKPASGKTELCKELSLYSSETNKKYFESISLTSRPPRIGEVNHLHYIFIDSIDHIDKDEMLEYKMKTTSAGVAAIYGTPLAPIDEQIGVADMITIVVDSEGYINASNRLSNDYGNEINQKLILFNISNDEILIDRLVYNGYSRTDALKRIYREDDDKQINEYNLRDKAFFIFNEYSTLNDLITKIDESNIDIINLEVETSSLKL